MNTLAKFGGKPIREKMLAYGKQWIDDNDIQAVINVLKGDYLTTGPNVVEFEKKLADYVGAKYAVAFSNGTTALHGACFAAGIEKDDEVLVSAMTFAASSNCVLYCDGKPVFIDIDEKTYNIDISKIEEKITAKTKAIIPVDYTGQPVDIDRIMEIAKKHNLVVIEDGAHSLGSEYKGKKVGSLADMTMFSFHPVKPVTTGEGGIITTNNESFYKKMCAFRTHGIIRGKSEMTKYDGPWYHEQHFLGNNYRITDMQSALGTSQMNKLDLFVNKRREIVKKYNSAFSEIEGVGTQYEPEYSNSGWHLYIIKLDLDKFKCNRREIYEALMAENIGVNVHYIPVYLHPYYQQLGYAEGLCPTAEKHYESIITLPLFPLMNDSDVNDVINAVKKVTDYYRK